MTKRSRRQSSPTVSAATPINDINSSLSNINNKEEEENRDKEEISSHFDLFIPLLKHYVLLVPPTEATISNNNDCKNENDNDIKLNNNNNKITTISQEDHEQKKLNLPHQRYEVLRSFVFPSAVTTYLRRVLLNLLLPLSDETLNNNNNNSHNTKRQRIESQMNHNNNNNEKDILTFIQNLAEVHLPAFKDDSEFLAAHEMKFVWKEWTNCCASIVTGNGQLQRIVEQAKLDIFRQCRPCQTQIMDLFTQHISIRLQKMILPPRIVRVAQKLNLQSYELEALTYLLICHCGSVWPLNCGSREALTPAAVASHNNLNSFQLMHFLAEYREHMKQGLIVSDIKYKSSFMDCKLAMPQEAIAALSGDSQSEEQLIKLEKTALAEIILAERETVSNNNNNNNNKTETNKDKSTTEVVNDKNGSLQPNNEEECEEDELNTSNGSSKCSTPKLESLGIDLSILQSGDETAIENALAEKLQAMLPSLQQQKQNHKNIGQNESIASSTSCLTNNNNNTNVAAVLAAAAATSSSNLHTPYESDIDYMDESFKLLANIVRLRGAESDMKDDDESLFTSKNKVEANVRELRGKVRVATAVHRARTAATLKSGKFIPRIEELSQRLQLSELEKRIMLLLVGNVVSHDMLIAINGRYVMREGQRVLTVGYILFVLCDTLKERVSARKSFYQSGPLLSNNILSLTLDSIGRTCFNTDLMDYIVDIDRKIVDYLMGTETETAEMVPGSRLYMPVVPMENVVLPKATTELVLTTIQHYSIFEECKRSCGFGEGLGTQACGLVFLFYGPSGTGKTMLANAVANELRKRILLVNLQQFKGDAKAPDMLRFIFREAKLNDAMVFFDECESIFESRESNPLVTSILAEFEKYDGLIVLATNKAQVIDEAMNRRISLMIEFRLPDPQMREAIWRAHLPLHLKLNKDVSISSLALNYELSGGLIRNATLAALSRAVAREKTSTPTICMQDLEEGARLQLRGFFLAAEKPVGASSESYFTPKRALSDLVVELATQQQLNIIVQLAKGRSTLFSQWGFREDECGDNGSLYLFHGPSGSGKSLAAEGIAYECGATIRLSNLAELLLMKTISVHDVFDEGRKLGAIIVFDEAQVLFNHSERSAHVAKLIHYHAVRYPRPVIFIATTGTVEASTIDVRATQLVFQQQIIFRLPTQQLRRELWRRAIPEKVPIENNGVDLDELSKLSVSAKLIRAAAFSACCKVAMLPIEERKLTTEMLQTELEEMRINERHRHPHSQMFA